MVSKFAPHLLFLTTVLSIGSAASAAPTKAAVPLLHGYRVNITGVNWSNNLPNTNLSIAFNITNADGTPVRFATPSGAVNVSGWSDSPFDSSINHESAASMDGTSQAWRVDLPGLDPREKVAHLEFDIRDPKTTPTQTTALNSEFQFDQVPIPTAPDVTEPVNFTFTSDWGTSVTLKGVTLASNGQNNGGQPQSRFDLVVNHPSVPDDSFQLQFEKGLHNGEPINGMWQNWSDFTTSSFVTATSGGIAPGSIPFGSFAFLLNEKAYSTVKSIAWSSVVVDLPLKGVPQPVSFADVADQGSTDIAGVHYVFQHMKSAQSWQDSYLVLTKFPDPRRIYSVKDAAWTASPGAQSWQNSPPNLTRTLYIHADGTPLLPTEHESCLQSNGGQKGSFPLILTIQQSSHEQQIVAFHNIPIPVDGQTLILRRLPDSPAGVPLRLKSIALNVPSTNPDERRNADPSRAYTLQLTFQCVVTDNASMAMSVVAARDDQNNSVQPNLLSNVQGTSDPASVDPNQRIFVVQIPVPPHGGKTINLKTFLTKDTPAGPDQKFSVDVSGNWTLSSGITPPPPLAQPAPAAQQAQQNAAPTVVSPAAVSSQVSKGCLVTVSNLKWDNSSGVAALMTFTFTLTDANNNPIKFVNPNSAIDVVGWAEPYFDNSVNRLAIATIQQDQKSWFAQLPGIDPRDKTVHLLFEIRDPATTTEQGTTLNSDVRFTDVPMPLTSAKEDLDDKFTTNWGTVITLKGVTLNASTQYNQAGTKLDFSVDHPSIPDDAIGIQFQKVYDNGISIDGLYSMYGGQYSTDPELTAFIGQIPPGAHSKATFEFQFAESAYTPIQSIAWTPVALDIPLLTVPDGTQKFTPSTTSTKTINDVDYSFEHVTTQQSYNSPEYVLTTRCKDPQKYCRITDANWKVVSTNGGYSPPTTINTGLYWHTDGTPLNAGEFAADIQQDSNNGAGFPITLTSQLESHSQELAEFSNVPVPAKGKTIILDQQPDHATIVPFRLRAISWKIPPANQNYSGVTHTLVLTFEYHITDSSLTSLRVVAANDDKGNVVGEVMPMANMGTNYVPQLDTDMQTVTEEISIPPLGAKTIDLQTLISKEIPSGTPTNFQINADGSWVVLGDSAGR